MVEDELFVVATRRADGNIPMAEKILGIILGGRDVAGCFFTYEEAVEFAKSVNMEAPGFSAPYGVYRAIVRLEEIISRPRKK